MGERFEIAFREQVTTLHAPDVETVWKEYVSGFGPIGATCAALPQDRRDAFRSAFKDYHRPYETGLGFAIPRLALVVRGVRH